MSETLLIHYNIDQAQQATWALCNSDGELTGKITSGPLSELSEAAAGHAAVVLLNSQCLHINQLQLPTQNLQKLSYYVPLYADTQALSADIRQRLEASGISANLVWSIDEPNDVGLLDVLPARADKRHAVSFLMQRNGFSLAEAVFAGDSGNDLPVLVSEIPAVLVANASEAVRHEALSQAAALGNPAALYIAHGGYLGMNGNYTAGVLEGVVHFNPAAGDWLVQDHAGEHACE